MPSILENEVLEDGRWKEIQQPAERRFHLAGWRKIIDIVSSGFGVKPRGVGAELSKTAYLDGLRGFAAFLVYLQHHNLWVHLGGHQLENAFGFKGKHFFSTLPFIRLCFTGGHLAVTTFFVISGYVLAAKPLQLIHAGHHEKLLENVASALFRRWIRLYLPIIATTFIYLSIWHMFGVWTQSEDREKTYGSEVWKWYCEIKNFTFVFNTGATPWFSYNRHLWSIPVEFRGSILLYTTLIALSRCTRNARLWCQVGLIWYFVYVVDGTFCAMFIAGMLICDLELLAQSNNLPRFFQRLEPYRSIILLHFLAIALYLGGIPAFENDTNTLKKSYGWFLLSFLKPQAVFDYKWFYLFWASTLLVVCTSQITWLRSFFENRYNQHLGRISFGLYLVHGPVLKVLGDRLYAAVGWVNEGNTEPLSAWVNRMPLPKLGPMGLEISFLVPQLLLLPVTLWVAELVTRTIDVPSVKFARWLYGKTLAPSQSLKG